MNDNKSEVIHNSEKRQRLINLLIIIVNIVLLISALFMYTLYNSAYKERLNSDNLNNITNLNQSASSNFMGLLDSWDTKLNDIVVYVEKYDFTLPEVLDFISDSNTDEDRYIEVIGSDYKGFLAKSKEDGTYPTLDFTHSSYEPIQKIFDGAKNDSDFVGLVPEYTDSLQAVKFFAKYRYMTLKNPDGTVEHYTVMLASSTKKMIQRLNMQNGYIGQSTTLIDSKGYYLLSNNNFKSNNFFQYLYIYNDLSLNRKLEIENEVKTNGSGELLFKNAGTVIEDCVFRYDEISGEGWYCVTCVPISSFHEPAFKLSYVIYAIILVVILFTVDMLWLRGINRSMRTMMMREKAANATKGNFMSRMSHEIRTPLNAVIGYNTIAINDISSQKETNDIKNMEMKVMSCLLKSEIALKHLLTIINDVLDMSAIENGKIIVTKERFDFRGLITSLTAIFYSQAKSKGINFEVIINELISEWFIGDQLRVNQVLTNLLSNAIKFTPDGGSVMLRITQSDVNDSSRIRFEVIDTGIGMATEYLNHIWVPFEQADSSISRRFGGSGLGLSITKNLVDLMNGTIEVKSSLGHGSTFTVELPFEIAEQTPVETYNFNSVNALVVDDDESTCDYIRLLFNRCGAKCATVTSGDEAITAVRNAVDVEQMYTVCLIDWHMPHMDGLETARRIKEIAGDGVPIIVLTAYDYSEVADKAAKAGISKFVTKPLFQSSLFDLLATISGPSTVQPQRKTNEHNFSGERILLVEDNEMNMEIAKTILESSGLKVDSAWDGQQAIDKFTGSKAGTYKVILMDVHMPIMNGHDATRAIRASLHPEARTIPIIAMTADAFAENVVEAEIAGMNGHISKPIDMAILFDTLKRYI